MKSISAFDLDHTLVSSNSSLLFYRHLISKGFYRPISLIRTMIYSARHYFLNLSLTELHEKVFERFLKGVSLKLVQKEVEQFLEKDFYRFLYYPTLARLRYAQHQGHYTVILSNAPSFVVGPIAEYLGVNEWYSSKYRVDQEGNFESVESVLLGEGKADCMDKLSKRLKTARGKITAYSDSDLDLPFLQAAGRPVAVNPSSKLLKISKEHAWEIL
ncbi:MAG: HAD family phosphatase [Chlamydiia bacterium]|nr:HAD family phosphatase [Chlamydiia bacterium]